MGIKMTGGATMNISEGCYIGPLWHPIETAPENKRVLVFCDKGICTADRSGDTWQSRPCPSDAGDSCIFNVTHWMHLPDQP